MKDPAGGVCEEEEEIEEEGGRREEDRSPLGGGGGGGGPGCGRAPRGAWGPAATTRPERWTLG
jgi:hypothetical protein